MSAARLESHRVSVTRGDVGPVGGRSGLGGSVPGGVSPVTEFTPVIVALGPKGAVRLEGDRVVFSRRDSGLVKRWCLEEPIARWH